MILPAKEADHGLDGIAGRIGGHQGRHTRRDGGPGGDAALPEVEAPLWQRVALVLVLTGIGPCAVAGAWCRLLTAMGL